MKTMTFGMKQHINENIMKLAMIWKLTRPDATVLSFTDHDLPLIHDGVTYRPESGFSRSTISGKSDMSVDNTDLESILAVANVTAADLRAGRYDGADIEISLVKHDEPDLPKGDLAPSTSNVIFASAGLETMQLQSPGTSWRAFGFEVGQTIVLDDPLNVGTLNVANQREFTIDSFGTASVPDDVIRVTPDIFVQTVSSDDFRLDTSTNGDGMGRIILRFGQLGEIKIKNSTYVSEIRGLLQVLTKAQGEVTNALCRVDLFSTRCGLVASGTNAVDGIPFKESDTVLTVAIGQNRVFVANAAITGVTGRYDQGLLTWTSGLNTGISMEVKTWDQATDTMELFLPMPFVIAVGDAFDVHQGCLKRLIEDCKDTFDNVPNFRGEPHLPGVDQMVKMLDAS